MEVVKEMWLIEDEESRNGVNEIVKVLFGV